MLPPLCRRQSVGHYCNLNCLPRFIVIAQNSHPNVCRRVGYLNVTFNGLPYMWVGYGPVNYVTRRQAESRWNEEKARASNRLISEYLARHHRYVLALTQLVS